MKYRCWTGTQFWTPKEVVYPASREDLKAIILSAKERGLKIRAMGSLHSYNDICATADIQVNTNRLNKILSIDRSKMTVRVESGIKLKALVKALAKEGLSLPNQGYILKQAVAGATATATHGTGHTGTLSSFIEEIELVDARGEICLLSPKTNEHLFSAAVVNLGCLGLIYSITLRCVALENLEFTKVKSTLQETLKELPQLLKTYQHFMFAICPYTENTITARYRKTDQQTRHRWGYILHRKLLRLIGEIGMRVPLPRRLFANRFKTYSNLSHNFMCVDESYRILSPADQGPFVEEEVIIPVEYLEKAIREALDLIVQYSKNHLIISSLAVRFVGPDAYGYLSPNLHQPVACLTYLALKKEGSQEVFKAFENAMFKYRGRPHWGKIHTLTKEKVKELYPETYHRFLEAKNELDSNGLFSNDYIDRLFKSNSRWI